MQKTDSINETADVSFAVDTIDMVLQNRLHFRDNFQLLNTTASN